MAELFRYAAFISYSSRDAAFARRVHRALESYRIPTSLGEFDVIGEGKKNRIFPVFRDREELSAGTLGQLIEASLKASAALIVICSPNGAASPWVNKEIEFFSSLGRRNRIFAIVAADAPLTDAAGGEVTAVHFPSALAAAAPEAQPLAADARKGRDPFHHAILKLVAGLIDVNVGSLVDRDRAERRANALRVSAASLAAVSIVGVGLGVFAAQQGQVRAQTLAELARRANEQGYYDRAARYALAGLSAPDVLRWMGLDDRDAESELRRAAFNMSALAAFHGDADARTGAGACSNDGTLVATASGNSVSLWSAADGTLLRRLTGHEGLVGSVGFNTDGTRLATGSADDTVRVWDVQSGRQLLRIDEPDVSDVAMRGRAVFALSEERWTVRNDTDGAMVYEAPLGFSWARLSPDSSRLLTEAYVSPDENIVQMWDLSTGAELAALRLPIRRLLDANFRNDTAYALVTGGSDVITDEHSTARVFDVMTGREVVTARSVGFISSGQFSPSGEEFVTAGGVAEVWRASGEGFDPRALAAVSTDRVTPNRIATLRGHGDARSAVFCGSENRVVTVGPESGARLWDIAPPMPATTHLNAVIDGYQTDGFVRISHAGFRSISYGAGNDARIWDRNGQLLRTLAGHTEMVRGAAFSPDDTMVATASWDDTIRLWSVADGRQLAVLTGHTDDVVDVAFSPDGARIVSASNDGTARIWNAAARREERQFVAPANTGVHAAAFTPDGQNIVADADGIRIWNLATGELVTRLEGMQPVAFDRSGRRMLTGSNTGGTIWNAKTWRPQLMLSGERIWTASFSPDGERVATGSAFGLMLWDARTGRELSRIPIWGQFVSVDFGPDGAWVASAPGPTLIPAFFDLHPSANAPRRELIASVCTRLTRGMSAFSEEERREAPALNGTGALCTH